MPRPLTEKLRSTWGKSGFELLLLRFRQFEGDPIWDGENG